MHTKTQGDQFGWSVAVGSDLVVVGAYKNDDPGASSGSAYVFETTDGGASWNETAKLVASDAAAVNRFFLTKFTTLLTENYKNNSS
jgi:hypothetical protein